MRSATDQRTDTPAARGFMGRLARDTRGNVLAISAIALIPLAGMIGGGIDMSRLYIAKTRLQHACDAGALAGRKSMGAGAWSQNSGAPNTSAVQFFDGNYDATAYGGSNTVRTFTESAGRVTGTASVDIPMTLMRIFAKPTQTLSVSCSAEMRLPNTDVMFVLDTTGSMNCVAGDGSCTNNGGTPASGSKIDGLKTAVKCFYETLARLNTTASCDGGDPDGGTGGEVQIRFGFMPYSSNVNVGRLLPTSYLANRWTYQSRKRNGINSAWSDWQVYSLSYPNRSGNCNATDTNTATTQYRSTRYYDNNYNQNLCRNESRFYGPEWTYAATDTDVSGLKNGTSWNASFTLPINNDGTNRTITWDGCIEERPTVKATNYSPIPAGAKDLDIDLVPAQGTANTLWGPALDQVIFYRNVVTSFSQATTDSSNSANRYYNPSSACPTEARKLQSWPTASGFESYVDSLVASGNTYHDIGLLWGARFLSPTGIFASENGLTPTGGSISRNLIFITDGDATSNACDYNAYGVPWYDKRQTDSVGAAEDCGSRNQALVDQINARLSALCTAVKNKQITLWVLSYGGDTNSDTNNRLRTCATSSDYYFDATDPATLKTAFATIASQITQLRLIS